MLRSLTLISLACSLAVAGWMWTRQTFQASEPAPAAVLEAAATALEFSHRTTGTYAGPAPEGITLVWADQFRYCIEFGGSFVAGPGGTPSVGACPR